MKETPPAATPTSAEVVPAEPVAEDACKKGEIGPDKALSTLADFTKWLTGLSTAGLVFSVGLQQNIASYHAFTRWCIVASWAFYALSVIAGVLIQSAFPTLYEKKTYSIRDAWMVRAYLFGLGSLVAGSLAIFGALFSLTFTLADPERLTVKTAVEAVAVARDSVTGRNLGSVDAVELIKGADVADVAEESWHVRFLGTKKRKDDPDIKLDVYVDAWTRRTVVVAPPLLAAPAKTPPKRNQKQRH